MLCEGNFISDSKNSVIRNDPNECCVQMFPLCRLDAQRRFSAALIWPTIWWRMIAWNVVWVAYIDSAHMRVHRTHSVVYIEKWFFALRFDIYKYLPCVRFDGSTLLYWLACKLYFWIETMSRHSLHTWILVSSRSVALFVNAYRSEHTSRIDSKVKPKVEPTGAMISN